MDEQKAAALDECVEPGCECIEVEQLRAGDADAGEAVCGFPGGERNDAAAGRVGQLQDPGLPCLDQLERFVGSQPVDPERWLQRDDRAVELEPVHEREARVELVRLHVELPGGRSGELQLAPAQARGLRSRRERGEERRRPEVLVDVDRRHGSTLSCRGRGRRPNEQRSAATQLRPTSSVRDRHGRAGAETKDEPRHRVAVQPDAAV